MRVRKKYVGNIVVDVFFGIKAKLDGAFQVRKVSTVNRTVYILLYILS